MQAQALRAEVQRASAYRREADMRIMLAEQARERAEREAGALRAVPGFASSAAAAYQMQEQREQMEGLQRELEVGWGGGVGT